MECSHRKTAGSLLRRIGAFALAALFAFSATPVAALAETRPLLAQDDQERSAVFASISVTGPSEANWVEQYVNYEHEPVAEGTTVAEFTEAALRRAGITHESVIGEYYYLSSITAPTTGVSYSWDEQSGDHWMLYINGELSELGADQVELREDMSVVWYYGHGDDTFTQCVDWHGYANAGAGTRSGWNTPSVAEQADWTFDLKADYLSRHPEAAQAVMGYVNVSDLITSGEGLLVAVGEELQLRDLLSGEAVTIVNLSHPIDYTARPLLIDGLLIVPEHGGVLEAFAIDDVDITRAWITDEIDPNHQNSGALVSCDGKVFAATFEYGSDYTVCEGALACVDIATGTTEWVARNETSGYYWGGVAIAGDYALVADDAGDLRALSLADGSPVSTLALGAGVRSVPQASVMGDELYVVSVDGVLHQVAIAGDGSLTQAGACDFAVSSTCTPAVWNGYAFVGGTSDQTVTTTVGDSTYQSPGGKVAVIDLTSMEIRDEATTLDSGEPIPGDVKSFPLLSAGYDSLDMYFTANAYPGALYALNLGATGEVSVRSVFTPSAEQQNYCMSSPVLGNNGVVLYTNDSGTLFKLGAGELHWAKEAGFWYLLDARGNAQTAWHKMGNSWYVLDYTGKMQSGWYYGQFYEWGWYWLGGEEDGRLASGWRLINGSWYYLDPETYLMQTGWTWVDGEWYWLGTSGAMHTGWQFLDGAWYYFDESGHMLRNQVVDGYTLSASGAWVV